MTEATCSRIAWYYTVISTKDAKFNKLCMEFYLYQGSRFSSNDAFSVQAKYRLRGGLLADQTRVPQLT